VNLSSLKQLNPDQIKAEIQLDLLTEKLDGPESEIDETWSYVARKSNPRWLWCAIDSHRGKILAYIFETRKDKVFLRLKALLEPFGITKFYPDSDTSNYSYE
jgi:insertion element IS1 protein InsB